MKQLLLLVLCVLLLSGCSGAEPSASSSSSAPGTTLERAESESLQAVSFGGYSAEIPNEWVVDGEHIYCGEYPDYPFITYLILDESSNLSELFPFADSKSEFMNSVCDEMYDNSAYSCSEMKESSYGDISALSFNATGMVEGLPVSFVCNLFDNPGGGVLAVSLSHSKDSFDVVEEYLRIFRSMKPSPELSVNSIDSYDNSNKAEDGAFHLYSNSAVYDVMNGTRTEKLGEYSVSFAESSDCTDAALADWYNNYIRQNSFNYAFIKFTDLDGFGVFETSGVIDVGVEIYQDQYGDYGWNESPDARTITISEDGSVKEWTD